MLHALWDISEHTDFKWDVYVQMGRVPYITYRSTLVSIMRSPYAMGLLDVGHTSIFDSDHESATGF